jgi:PAS domain S-box-containing protein
MTDSAKTPKHLLEELKALRRQVERLEAQASQTRQTAEASQQAHRDLERRMAERTAELLKANEHLKQEIEDRKRAEQELKRTKEYLENVIDNSVDAIGIVDHQGRFLLWNRRAAEIYGYRFHELEGKRAFDLYADPRELEAMLTRLRQDGVVREYEIQMKKRDGAIVPMDISISLLKDEQGRTIGSVCVARDISERRKTELKLKEAQEELSRYSKDLERQIRERTSEISAILRYTPAVVYIKDREGRYQLVNFRFEELFGISNEAIRGKNDYEIFPLETADRFRENDLQVLREKSPLKVEEPIYQDDAIHTYLSVKFPLYDERGDANGVCGISTDITELKKAQDQLRLLSGSIMASQEKERTAIARELHDELGQVLTALRLDSVWLSDRLRDRDPRGADRAATMCGLIDKTIDEVRGLATRLRPGVLDDFGLIEALNWYIKEFSRRTGITCSFDHGNVPEVDGVVATAAYRITQEALTNVARHSFATQVQVSLEGGDQMLTLAVVDNGRGFYPLDLRESACLGLAGMRERASLLGGILDIHANPFRGTQVRFRLPMDKLALGKEHPGDSGPVGRRP